MTHELSDRLVVCVCTPVGEDANRDDAGSDRDTVCYQLVPVLHCTTLSARRPRSSEQLLGSHYNRYTPAPRIQVKQPPSLTFSLEYNFMSLSYTFC